MRELLGNELVCDGLEGDLLTAIQRHYVVHRNVSKHFHPPWTKTEQKSQARINGERNGLLFWAMPDTGGRRKRGSAWTLSNAHEVGQLVVVQCGLCNVKRWSQPSDLWEIFGDVEAEQVGSKMSCERCGKNEFMHVETQNPSARERQIIRVRRLAEIRIVRRVIWRDEN
ncbi:hypothetical protein [Mesorhizobium sp. M1365]|uniref:hypothetical protein n=1 Tax=Mesorhizobium sp. M1365 TaxID=2957090 RepID=UPI003339C8F4